MGEDAIWGLWLWSRRVWRRGLALVLVRRRRSLMCWSSRGSRLRLRRRCRGGGERGLERAFLVVDEVGGSL